MPTITPLKQRKSYWRGKFNVAMETLINVLAQDIEDNNQKHNAADVFSAFNEQIELYFKKRLEHRFPGIYDHEWVQRILFEGDDTREAGGLQERSPEELRLPHDSPLPHADAVGEAGSVSDPT